MHGTNSPAYLADQRSAQHQHTDLAIETAGLAKRFGDVVAVDGVDLRVPLGRIFALLGPDGAGKTTVIRMLACLLRPDAGTARVLGHDVSREPDVVRGSISLTGQFASVDEDLTGRENLVLLARLLGHRPAAARRRSDDLLAAFGLAEAANRQVKKYSGGMRRRLDIAASIVVTPRLLFLDEPTTGLDPRSRAQVWDIARELVAAGTTVMLTTQYLDEADALADRIAVIDRGRVIAEGTSADLKLSVGAGSVRVRVRLPEQRAQAADVLSRELTSKIVLESDPGLLSARTDDAEQVVEALHRVVRSGVAVAGFSLAQPSLDEVFMAITGHAATASAGLEEDEPPEGPATGEEEHS